MRTPVDILAELARLIPAPEPTPPPAATPARDFDWAAWDRAAEDSLAAMGEPDRDGPWLVAGRRAVWGQR